MFALLFLAIQSVLALPISYYTTMHLDKEFGFSKVSLSLFLRIFQRVIAHFKRGVVVDLHSHYDH